MCNRIVETAQQHFKATSHMSDYQSFICSQSFLMNTMQLISVIPLHIHDGSGGQRLYGEVLFFLNIHHTISSIAKTLFLDSLSCGFLFSNDIVNPKNNITPNQISYILFLPKVKNSQGA